MTVIEERRESGQWGQRGAEADRASFTEEVGRVWGGREKGRHGGGTLINMSKGLDAGVGDVSS